jgi:hypothetical protein
MMSGYRVSFYKDLLSSDGHSFKCLQQHIDVPESVDITQAADFASRMFASLHGLRDWTLYADSLEVVPADVVAPQQRAA